MATSETLTSVRCSAPGKVLIAGGYLILDKENKGLVISTTARFHSTIEQMKQKEEKTLSLSDPVKVIINSPQFSTRNEIEIMFDGNGNISLSKEAEKTPIYIRLCLLLGIGLVRIRSPQNTKTISPFMITLQADNDFYSQQQMMESRNLPKSMESYSKLQNFEPVNGSLSEIRKTGLGSSATLVSSLLASLFIYFGSIIPSNGELSIVDKNYLHNVAQVVHCAAQGKVGSGFDISTAVFGSQVYSRFSKSIIESVLSDIDGLAADSKSYQGVIHRIHLLCSDDSKWDHTHTLFHLPPYLSMTLGDVNAGANTPSMVSKLLQWKRESPDIAERLWKEQGKLNDSVERLFTQLQEKHDYSAEEYVNTLNACSNVPYHEWNSLLSVDQGIVSCLLEIHSVFIKIRGNLKKMGNFASVPVEPDEQTRLIDATIQLPGVVTAAVPGAGGFDALFSIVIDTHGSSSFQSVLEKHWVEWKEMSVLPQLVREDPQGGIHLEFFS